MSGDLTDRHYELLALVSPHPAPVEPVARDLGTDAAGVRALARGLQAAGFAVRVAYGLNDYVQATVYRPVRASQYVWAEPDGWPDVERAALAWVKVTG